MKSYKIIPAEYWGKDPKESVIIPIIEKGIIPKEYSVEVYNMKTPGVTIYTAEDLNTPTDYLNDLAPNYRSLIENLQYHIKNDNVECSCRHSIRVKNRPHIQIWFKIY